MAVHISTESNYSSTGVKFGAIITVIYHKQELVLNWEFGRPAFGVDTTCSTLQLESLNFDPQYLYLKEDGCSNKGIFTV